MSFATEAKKSVSDPRVLVELDIAANNKDWVNNGAGVWAYSFDALYSWVDSTLLDGFVPDSRQPFVPNIGSVYSSGVQLIRVATLLEASSPQAFFWDSINQLHVCLQNFDEPSIHDVRIGIIFGYSFDEFTPAGMTYPQLYEGRLISAPNISTSRDPLFFGKIQFGGGSVTLNNADGSLDAFGQDHNIYGNEARIFLGFEDLDKADYEQLFTGYIGDLSIGEGNVSVNIKDRRAQLSRPILYSASALNAIDAIQAIMVDNFNILYTSSYFDTVAWASAQAKAANVTIDMQNPEPAIDIIEGICASVFGSLSITADGKFSFVIVDTSVEVQATVLSGDIRSDHRIVYDPTEAVSSIRVGYNRDWLTVASTVYTWHTDLSEETATFVKYKTYNQIDFPTYLVTEADAASLATAILTYSKDVHGQDTVLLPIAYYERRLGDIIDVEIERPQKTMIGTTKTEIVNVTYDLNKPAITLGVRFVV